MSASAPHTIEYRQDFENLQSALQAVRQKGLASQSVDFIETFSSTYLSCLGWLTHLRNLNTESQELRRYQNLLIQANLVLYPEPKGSAKSIWRAIWTELPAQLWRDRYYHLAAFILVALSGVLGWLIVCDNFEMAPMFLPSGLRSSYELEAYLFSKEAQSQMLTAGRGQGVDQLSFFAAFLFTNNFKVALLCFTLGILDAIPTVIILLQTGLMMGALVGLFWGGDVVGLGAWLLPHGVPEISAVILAGGAGLKLGKTMLSPGDDGLGKALPRVLKQLMLTVLLLAVLLVWAALVESFVRQSTLGNLERYLISMASCIPLILLFVRAYFAARSFHASPALPSSPATGIMVV